MAANRGSACPSRAANGMPWMLPEGVVLKLCESIWASIQISPRSRRGLMALRAPPQTPMAQEWSPPIKIKGCASATIDRTRRPICLQSRAKAASFSTSNWGSKTCRQFSRRPWRRARAPINPDRRKTCGPPQQPNLLPAMQDAAPSASTVRIT